MAMPRAKGMLLYVYSLLFIGIHTNQNTRLCQEGTCNGHIVVVPRYSHHWNATNGIAYGVA